MFAESGVEQRHDKGVELKLGFDITRAAAAPVDLGIQDSESIHQEMMRNRSRIGLTPHPTRSASEWFEDKRELDQDAQKALNEALALFPGGDGPADG